MKEKIVYKYKFSDNSIYIGITIDLDRRHKEHLRKKASPIYTRLHSIPYELVVLLKTDEHTARLKETEYILRYQTHYRVLNKINGGASGGKLKWTKDRLREELEKHGTVKELRRNEMGAFLALYRKYPELIEEKHRTAKPQGYWTKSRLIKEAGKYKSRGKFQLCSPSAYMIASKKGYINEICNY